MPVARALGILIVFGIVFMVLGGAVWHFTESWTAVFVADALTAFFIIPPVIMQVRRVKH